MLFSKSTRGSKLLTTAVLAIGLSALFAAPAQADSGGTWGAISIGNHGRAYAIVTGYPSQQEADDAANSKCGFTDCDWKLDWDSDRSDNLRCGAAAVTSDGHWGWAQGSTSDEAEQDAENDAGPGAGAQVSGCDTITRGPQN
ncbi:MAG: hypothetical protein JWN03_7558 [Nocardia sp.]|uniref:DUF4189 domain-containing protein n=1 Tax=Nocardia sp. TaxID=1821 RepID=UPI002621623C|nr:DUF4189 domain-containing protein [Nocardia sp.]MCU1647283.1 hypothetical protein [Nocardia sp.]